MDLDGCHCLQHSRVGQAERWATLGSRSLHALPLQSSQASKVPIVPISYINLIWIDTSPFWVNLGVQALFHRRADRIAELLGDRAVAKPVKARLFNFRESLTVIRLLKSSAIGEKPPLFKKNASLRIPGRPSRSSGRDQLWQTGGGGMHGLLAGQQQECPTQFPGIPVWCMVSRRQNASAGRLVTIRGTVVRASNVKPLVTHLDFLCSKCGEMTSQQLVDGIYQPPTSCKGDGCRGRTFLPHRKSAKTMDWQKLRIQVLSHTHRSDCHSSQVGTKATLQMQSAIATKEAACRAMKYEQGSNCYTWSKWWSEMWHMQMRFIGCKNEEG
jgi:hypothetical protein